MSQEIQTIIHDGFRGSIARLLGLAGLCLFLQAQ